MSQLKNHKKLYVYDIQMANHFAICTIRRNERTWVKDLAFEIAETYVDICKRLRFLMYLKASFDKANRSSLNSFRGPGLEKGIEWLADIKNILMCLSLLMYMNLTKLHL